MTLPTDYTQNDRLTVSVLNEIGNIVNAMTAALSSAATSISSETKSLTQLQTTNNSTQSNIVAANATLSTLETKLSNLQSSLATAQNRLTVLETVSPPPAVPGKPTSLAVGTITTTSVILTWVAPTGTAATSYQTRYATPQGSGNWVNGPSTTAPTVTTTITGLIAATPYDFSVVPFNASGPGTVSDIARAMTLSGVFQSPAWTEMPPATSIVMNDGGVVTLVAGELFLNGAAMGITSQVILALKSDTGRIYQEIFTFEWWYWDPTQADPWVFTSDPRSSVPGSGLPSVARDAGYTQLTFGSNPRTGWFVRDGTAVDQSDGSVRLISADGFNGGYATALMTGGYMNFTGTTFGGGAYFRFTAKWSGTGTGGGGWPQLWMSDAEGQSGLGLAGIPIQYPGRPNGQNLWFDIAAMRDQGTNAFDFGSTLVLNSTSFTTIQAALTRKTFPGGATDRTSYHTYGVLWVKATPTARGFMAFYYDDVEFQRVVWDFRANRNTLPAPPGVIDLGGNVYLINVGSDIDSRHMFLQAGSGSTSPIDMLKAEVWQASAANNIIDGHASGGTGGSPAPTIAANQGYNTNTFGPGIRVGGTNPNWFIINGTAVQQSDGAWRLVSTDGLGGGFVSAQHAPAGDGNYLNITTGTCFGGGFYLRYRAKWSGPGGGGTGGWASLWANDMEGQTGFSNSNSPIHYPSSGTANSNIWMKSVTMEDPGNFSSDYGSALHFFATDPPTNGHLDLVTTPSRFTWPNGSTTRTAYHWYGMLWVPATPSTRGYVAYTFDDVEYQRVSWDYRANRNTLPYPPSITTLGPNSYLVNVGSDFDTRHLFFRAGSGSATPLDLLAVEVWQRDISQNIGPTIAPPPPPTTTGPGSGPAFQNIANFQDMGNGQKCSTGMTTVTNDVEPNGSYLLAIKPWVFSGIWRGGDSGNFISPLTAAFVDRGVYLYLPDIASIYSANDCPPTNPEIHPVAGIRIPIHWWTAGNITEPISWGMYIEPGEIAPNGEMYAVINDYKPSRGDTFHSNPPMQGRGRILTKSWGSILDFSQDPDGSPGYGFGWIAFVGYQFSLNQIIFDW